ncbi:MAG: serpin family protein [Dehalococcoidales bacterium]|nr:serpin family protein [Dehalococcoidales bacterium]
MKKILIFIVSAIALLALAACTQPASASELKSNKPRETAPAAGPADITSLVNGNNEFALNLYRLLKDEEGNFFYSPYSISEALAMTCGGARGETEEQMANTLRFILSREQLHPAFNAIDIELAKRGQGAKGKDGEGFRLNVVNALWGQKDFKFSSEYLDLLAQNYGAGMRIVDYIKATEESRQTINQWVSDQTEDRIKDLLPQGSITPLTRLVLTNAIYFNAAWSAPFEKEATKDGQFHLLDGSTVNVPMMKQMKSFKYAEGSNYQAVELPYDGNELSMVLILPAEGQLPSFESALDSRQLDSIIGSLKSNPVTVTMPRFKIESQFSLKEALGELGMPIAFSESEADFSGMDGKKDLFISDVIHKSFVDVDEEGTEAAAATGVIISTTSAPMDPEEITLDRPFIFLIRDNPTGSILFLGQVENPTK